MEGTFAMIDFLLNRSQMPDGVEVPALRSQASKWEADGKLRVCVVDDDADEVRLGLGFDLMEAVFGDADDSVILDLVLVFGLARVLDLVIRGLLDEAVGMAGDDEASAAALATAALVTLLVDIFANI